MERGQIVALPTVVIPPENTPQKTRAMTLIAHPRWKYIGPPTTIRFEWQIGQYWLGTFDGITARQYTTRSQPASTELAEFETSLPAISLSPLSPRDEPYICEIWFKDKFSDLRVIVENCVKIVEEAPVTTVTVALKNRPSGANKWQMSVFDWGFTQQLGWGLDAHNNIGEAAVFEIPDGWTFPLRIDIGILQEWQENGEWQARQLYWVQSHREYIFGEPDPDYKEVFIPEYGSYRYNVATEQFEKV
ncbi:hypothetical protein ES703_00347 [subsurface metagenome]